MCDVKCVMSSVYSNVECVMSSVWSGYTVVKVKSVTFFQIVESVDC